MISEPQWPEATPSDWTRCQFQYAFDHQRRDPLPEDEVVTAFRDGQVTLRRNRREDGFTNAAKEIGYQHVRAGDLVVHSMDGGFGAIGVSDSDGKASPVVHAYRSEHCDVHFMAYYLRAAVTAGWIAAHTKGIRERSTQFDRASLSRVEVAFPSLGYQRKIVGFLDRETAEIDAMDAELDRLVDTLQERKNAAIEDRLWSGLPRAIPMKMDCELVTSGSRGWAEFYADEGDRFLRIADLDRGTYRIKDSNAQHVRVPSGAEGTRTRTQPGDLLFSITAYLGSVGLVTEEHQHAYVSQHVALVRLGERLWKPEYVAYAALSASGQRYLTETGYGGTKTQLNLDQVRDIPVPVIALGDQERIVEELDAQTARIDEMIADANRLKALLAERRSTLITDVVTGKKEVPE